MVLKCKANKEYEVIIDRGILDKINNYYDFKSSKVLIITDDLIPNEYIEKVSKVSKKCYVFLVPSGESSKSLDQYYQIINYMIDNSFDKDDVIINVGGGVVTDLGGYVASTYKRGIKYINVPTSTLAMIDSSIGGKTALNFQNIKNAIGTFYFPSLVVIDVDTLNTLPKRHYYNGLVEALKMGLIMSKELFNMFFDLNNIDVIKLVSLSIKCKNSIVEEDSFDLNKRHILNFGHTIGHAIESIKMNDLYHGECVGKGMLYFINNSYLKQQVYEILHSMNIPLNYDLKHEDIYYYLKNDKKISNDLIEIVLLNDVNDYTLKKININDLIKYL